MPPSVPGIRTQATLKEEYLKLGGEFLLGDTVCAGDIKDSKVVSLSTVNFEEIKVMTDNVVLASGSFFSKGLIADPYKVYEPIFGLDVDFSENRGEWYNLNFFKKQNYVNFGVKTNEKFQTSIQGKTIENLYAIGSVLSGANTLYEGCGSGVAIMTAMKVADEIISK
jgi:glycerol-3-phosphate dehydrogenase subunit B